LSHVGLFAVAHEADFQAILAREADVVAFMEPASAPGRT